MEALVTAAARAGSQVHLWPEHFAAGFHATARSRQGAHHVAASGPDPVAALKSALVEEDRLRRDGIRTAIAAKDPQQIDLEDAIAAAPADEFEALLS